MRVFFSGRAIIIDGFRAPLKPDTLTATITNGIVSIVNAGNGMALVSSVWTAITDATGTSFATSDALMSYLAEQFGAVPPIGDTFGIAAAAGESLLVGTPVAVLRSNGQLVNARADTYQLSFVAGLAAATTAQGFTTRPTRGATTLSDWAPIAGSQALQQGAPYFLAPTGGLSLTPVMPGAACVTRIGIAASPSTLIVEPTDPITL